jgi:hypothetical protein
LIGGGFIALIVVLQTLVGWLKPTPGPGSLSGWAEYLGGLALLLAVAAAGEELLFRGYPFQVLVEAMGAPLAVILSAVAFGAIHAFNPEVGFTVPADAVAVGGHRPPLGMELGDGRPLRSAGERNRVRGSRLRHVDVGPRSDDWWRLRAGSGIADYVAVGTAHHMAVPHAVAE